MHQWVQVPSGPGSSWHTAEGHRCPSPRSKAVGDDALFSYTQDRSARPAAALHEVFLGWGRCSPKLCHQPDRGPCHTKAGAAPAELPRLMPAAGVRTMFPLMAARRSLVRIPLSRRGAPAASRFAEPPALLHHNHGENNQGRGGSFCSPSCAMICFGCFTPVSLCSLTKNLKN